MLKPEWCVPSSLQYVKSSGHDLPVAFEVRLGEFRLNAKILRDGDRYVLLGKCRDGRTMHTGFVSAIAAKAYGDRNLVCMKERIDGRKKEGASKGSEGKEGEAESTCETDGCSGARARSDAPTRGARAEDR